MLTLDTGKEFGEYLKGKRVALVSRAPYLWDVGWGEQIDSYDIVARLHRPIPHWYPKRSGGDDRRQATRYQLSLGSVIRPHPSSEYYGKKLFVPPPLFGRIGARTDLLVVNPVGIGEFEWISCYLEALKANGGQWLMSECYFYTRDNLENLDFMAGFLPTHLVDMPTYMDLVREMDYAMPLCGTVAVFSFLRFDIRELFLVGFPCYQDCRQKMYAHPEAVDDYKRFLGWGFDPEKDFAYLMKRYEQDERLDVDSTMQELWENQI